VSLSLVFIAQPQLVGQKQQPVCKTVATRGSVTHETTREAESM